MRTVLGIVLALSMAGCASVGPSYTQPAVDTPLAFKEGQGAWVAATPADALDRGPWWELFGDPVLNGLAERVTLDNQNVAQAVAAYEQARAITAEQRASLSPTVGLDVGANRRGGGGGTPGSSNYSVSIGGSWEPDVWGQLRRSVNAASESEQASTADLAAARLSAQGELAADYFGLRSLDVARSILGETIVGYQRNLQITTNRYNAGIVARTDVLQAQTALASAQADALGVDRSRAQLEHAIAVLVGVAPASFSLPAEPTWTFKLADVPQTLPSTLLQRRPDIAAAERRVAAANEQIGIAIAGYYPSLTLNGNIGQSAASIGDLFNVSALAWSVGVQLAQSIFNGGLTGARVEAARAQHDAAAARYRQTVLSAFQQVEDQLVASRILAQQLALRQQASEAADLVEQQVLNRYQAGQVGYTDVITAQTTALSARRALVQLQSDRQTAAVALIQALGGGWKGL